MAFRQIVWVVVTWWQMIRMIWREPRSNDVGYRWQLLENYWFFRWRRPGPILRLAKWTWKSGSVKHRKSEDRSLVFATYSLLPK